MKSYSWCSVDFEFQSSVHWTRKRGENVPRRDQSSHTIWLGKYRESPHTQKDRTHLLHLACYDKYWFPVWQSRNEKQREMMVNEPDTIKYNIPFSLTNINNTSAPVCTSNWAVFWWLIFIQYIPAYQVVPLVLLATVLDLLYSFPLPLSHIILWLL